MALEAQNNPYTSILMVEAADPEALSGDADPAAGQRRLVVGTDHLLYLLDDSGVKHLVGGGLTDPMTTRGDMIIRNASNVTARLARGSAGKVLTSDGTDIAWQSPSAGALTYVSANLGSPVTTNTSTYTDILSLSLAAGTWMVFGVFMCAAASVAAIELKLWDGTTVFGSSNYLLQATGRHSVAITAEPIVLGSTTTVKVSGLSIATAVIVRAVTSDTSLVKATNLVAIKLA